jgi:PadR family transcriptional regulator, regulatory protein PadR
MPITKSDKITRNFFLGFIRLHLLHHASIEPIFGLDMIRELGRHGYSLSPGTLYPILHGLEQDGFLESQKQVVAGKVRKYYQITKSGRTVLAQAVSQMQELIDELNEA